MGVPIPVPVLSCGAILFFAGGGVRVPGWSSTTGNRTGQVPGSVPVPLGSLSCPLKAQTCGPQTDP